MPTTPLPKGFLANASKLMLALKLFAQKLKLDFLGLRVFALLNVFIERNQMFLQAFLLLLVLSWTWGAFWNSPHQAQPSGKVAEAYLDWVKYKLVIMVYDDD